MKDSSLRLDRLRHGSSSLSSITYSLLSFPFLFLSLFPLTFSSASTMVHCFEGHRNEFWLMQDGKEFIGRHGIAQKERKA